MGSIRIVVCLLLLSLAACAEDKSAPAASSPDPFFRKWTRDDGAITIDITGGKMNYTSDMLAQVSGFAEKCICDISIPKIGTTGNTYHIHNCGYDSAVVADPGCPAALEEHGTYTISGGVLTVCTGPTTCATYR